MDARGEALVRDLGLQRHPEGGWFREVFRSPLRVAPADGRPERCALTVIHFLLAQGETSRWHRVASDEAWSWIEGAPLELFRMHERLDQSERLVLGPPGEGASPVQVVPAGDWQAARTTGAYTLVSCAVGPGFEFADFEMLSDLPDLAAEAVRRFPEAADLV